MPSLLQSPTGQSELFEQLRARRIIVANQLATLVARGEGWIVAAIFVALHA